MLRDTSSPTATAHSGSGAPIGTPRHHDAPSPLQIANRAALVKAVERLLAKCRRYGDSLALLVIATAVAPPPALAGRLLELVGLRLRARVRGSDAVMRIGTEHFGVVLLHGGDARAHVVRTRLNRVLRGPYTLDGQSLEFAPELGCAVYPRQASDGEALVSAAWRQGAAPLPAQEGDASGPA